MVVPVAFASETHARYRERGQIMHPQVFTLIRWLLTLKQKTIYFQGCI